MRKVVTTRRFERDLQLAAKRGKKISKMERMIDRLQGDMPPERRYRAHPLSGNWTPYQECHIEPDWLLIYEITDQELRLIRNGTHADLF